MKPVVIFIHGPLASGKYTVAKELATICGVPLFHNHLTVDLLLAVFPFGSTEFIRHRERIWLDVMTDAVATGSSVIFTFNPERTVSPEFPQNLQSRIGAAGGEVRFVEIVCAEEEIEKRVEATSRREHQKLRSLGLYRVLKNDGAFEYPPLPSECRVDSSYTQPRESALTIARSLGLPLADENSSEPLRRTA